MGWDYPAASTGAAQSFIGYNVVGASSEAIANNAVYKQVVLAAGGLIISIGASIAGATASQGWSCAVMDDNAGNPGKVLAVTGTPNTTADTKTTATRRWVHVACGLYVPAGTYWLVFASTFNTASTAIAFDTGGTDQKFAASAEIDDAAISAPTAGTNKYSVRASFLSPL